MNIENQELRKLQMIELDILKVVASICDTHGLKYYLAEGTLLGAVRHAGFIPWDDDIDVVIPREDYEKFIRLAKTELPEYMGLKYFQNSNTNEKDMTFFIHPCDNRYTVTWKTVAEKDEKILPVWIDIGPLDGLPKNKIQQRLHLLRMLFLHKLVRCSLCTHISTDRKLAWWKKAGIFLIRCIRLDKLNTKRLLKKYDDTAKIYPYSKSEMTINYASEYGTRAICPKRWYGEGKMVQFEDTEFRIPEKAKKILAQEYGDYMMLPPESERKCKHIISLKNLV